MTYIIESSIDVETGLVKSFLNTEGRQVWCVMRIYPWNPEKFNQYLDFLSSHQFSECDLWYRAIECDDGMQVESIGNAPSKFHELSLMLSWEPNSEKAWDYVRGLRVGKLTASDWTQLPDVPIATKEAWAVYRQALRDITEQPDPFNIVWPVPPQ